MGLFFFCGKVYIVMFFCIYKISYQILFGFTVEYVLIRKKFFMKKVSKYHYLVRYPYKHLIHCTIQE